jgi:hypothetical protein
VYDVGEKDRAEVFGMPLNDVDRILWDMFTAAAEKWPDREAVVSMWQGEVGR